MIILMFGRSGSGKSAIAQNLIKRMGYGLELSGDAIRMSRLDHDFTPKGREKKCAAMAQVVLDLSDIASHFPIIITLEAPTEACRVAFLRKMSLMNSKVYRVYVHASLEIVEARDPELLYAADAVGELKHPMIKLYHTPHNDDIDLRLDSEACSSEKNAGFLWNFISSRS